MRPSHPRHSRRGTIRELSLRDLRYHSRFYGVNATPTVGPWGPIYGVCLPMGSPYSEPFCVTFLHSLTVEYFDERMVTGGIVLILCHLSHAGHNPKRLRASVLNVSSTVRMLAGILSYSVYKSRLVAEDSRMLTAGPWGQPGVGPNSGA